jgi:hypothetical protein
MARMSRRNKARSGKELSPTILRPVSVVWVTTVPRASEFGNVFPAKENHISDEADFIKEQGEGRGRYCLWVKLPKPKSTKESASSNRRNGTSRKEKQRNGQRLSLAPKSKRDRFKKIPNMAGQTGEEMRKPIGDFLPFRHRQVFKRRCSDVMTAWRRRNGKSGRRHRGGRFLRLWTLFCFAFHSSS